MKLLVNTCTVGVPFVKEIEQAMAARGVTVVDCPISGGPPGARAGTLSVMVSGDPAAVERVRPMISLWGRTLTVAGDKPGAAQVLKLTNNILFGGRARRDGRGVRDGRQGRARSRGHGRRDQRRQRPQQRDADGKFPTAVLTRSFDYGAEMHILMKDIDLAIAQGEELGRADVGLPGGAARVQARDARGRGRGRPERDRADTSNATPGSRCRRRGRGPR